MVEIMPEFKIGEKVYYLKINRHFVPEIESGVIFGLTQKDAKVRFKRKKNLIASIGRIFNFGNYDMWVTDTEIDIKYLYKTKKEAIDAMIKRLESMKDA